MTRSPSTTRELLRWTPRRLSRPLTAGLVVVYVLLVVWALAVGAGDGRRQVEGGHRSTDAALYEAIVDRMADGAGYYEVVAREQPARGYPTSPAVTVREPTLAWVTDLVGPDFMVVVLWVLVVLAVGACVRVLELTERSRASWIAAVVAAAAAVGIFAFPDGIYVHEVWTTVLVLLAHLAAGTGRVRAGVVLALAAALVRELAAPVLLLWLALAWRRGRRLEVRWCTGALLVFAAFYAVHAVRVHEIVGASSGSPSQGWLAWGGWPFVVDAVRDPSVLALAPHCVAAVLVPVGVLGWLLRAGPFPERMALVVVAYLLAFTVAGRPDNTYWGAFVAVPVVIGVALAASTVAAVVRRDGTHAEGPGSPV